MTANGKLPSKAGKVLGELLANFNSWRNQLNAITHDKVVEQMLEESGYLGMWRDEAKKEKSPEAEGRLENLRELVRALAEFDSLGDFLEHISLVMDNDQKASGEMVNIMTLHAAKGLEFDTVFLPGWEEGLFPHQRALDEGGSGGLEEERRLAYVGITRARKNLFITHAANRRIYNQWQNSIPSRFLKELPQENVDILPSNLGYNSAPRSVIPTQAGILSERSPTRLSPLEDDKVSSTFQTGQRIFHDKFGYGYIQNVSGDNLEINFDHSGQKTLKSGFVKRA
jgi:DNA helicase-2/ATP-dependent DNA helicase PcrA